MKRLLSFLPLTLIGCGGGMQSMTEPAGPQSSRLLGLTWFFLVICGSVYIIVIGALAFAAWRRGRDYTDSHAGPMIRRAVIGAVAATAVLLIVLMGASFAAGRSLVGPPRNPIRIEVRGNQWWWEVRYLDDLPSKIFTTANEIHIPVGRPVSLSLSSNDVIHSFWVPRLHGKIDLVPSRVNKIWMQSDVPGVFRGQCAEYCGLQHAHMGFYVIAEPRAEFDHWLSTQREPAVEPSDPLTQRGKEVYMNAPCVLCHSIRGTDSLGQVAPDLTHISSRRSIAAATLPNTPGHLAGWITDPQQIKPGNHMPPMSMAPEDLQALLAYLESLK